MSTLSVPVFGLGTAVQRASPPASALANGKGKMRALAPRMPKRDLALDLAAPHSHFNSSSPLSSLPSASAGPSPAGAAGSWWVSGVGSVYGGSASGEVGAFRFFSLDSWRRFFGGRGCSRDREGAAGRGTVEFRLSGVGALAPMDSFVKADRCGLFEFLLGRPSLDVCPRVGAWRCYLPRRAGDRCERCTHGRSGGARQRACGCREETDMRWGLGLHSSRSLRSASVRGCVEVLPPASCWRSVRALIFPCFFFFFRPGPPRWMCRPPRLTPRQGGGGGGARKRACGCGEGRRGICPGDWDRMRHVSRGDSSWVAPPRF
jgi:hypothetical protein